MRSKIIFSVLISLLACSPAFAQNSRTEGLSEREIKLLYGEFKAIRSFGLIAVSLVGDAEKIGLAAKPIRENVEDQFKKDFCKIPYRDETRNPEHFARLLAAQDPKIGSITFRIWVVGDSSRLAYHVRCDAGSFRNFSIWTEEVLGHGTKATIKQTINDIVAEMMKQLSHSFFTARGEHCD